VLCEFVSQLLDMVCNIGSPTATETSLSYEYRMNVVAETGSRVNFL